MELRGAFSLLIFESFAYVRCGEFFVFCISSAQPDSKQSMGSFWMNAPRLTINTVQSHLQSRFATSSTITGKRVAAGGHQPAAADPAFTV